MNHEYIKALIIDDEALACDMLEYLIQHHVPLIGQVKKTTSVYEGLDLLKTFQPELLFLDIQMPFMTGFELLSSIGDRPFAVIFTTAYDKYAIKAIRFSAMDYLLKPIDADDLKEAMERYIMKKEEHLQLGELYKNFIHNLYQKEKKDYRLSLYTNSGIRLVSTTEIVYCRGENNYTHFYLSDGKTIITSTTLKEYEEMLEGSTIVRVHKSFLVNLVFVKEIKGNSLELKNGTMIEISRRRHAKVATAIREFLQTGLKKEKK